MVEFERKEYLHHMFEFEKCLQNHCVDELVPLMKRFLSSFGGSKISLLKNSGLTLYAPSLPNNLQSDKSVIIFIHELSRTGAPVVAADTAKLLAKNGFFTVVVTMRRGPMLNDLLDMGIPVLYDRELASVINCSRLMNLSDNRFFADDLSESFDYVFVITAVYYNLIRRFSNFRRRVFWWLHEGSHSYEIFGPQMPKNLSPSVRVLAGGVYADNQLKEFGFKYDTRILNYGVADVFDSFSFQRKRDGSVVFLLPGSLSFRKGQHVLLEAIKKLPEAYRNKSKFIFIGDITSKYDTDGIKVKNDLLSARNIYSCIDYVPLVSREELFHIYQDIDVLLLASLDDPMPVVATEALMMGKVVLCSNATGTSYYLNDGENGFIFACGDSSALCSKIQLLIDHYQDLESIGMRGRDVFLDHFEMGVFEKRILQVLGEKR